MQNLITIHNVLMFGGGILMLLGACGFLYVIVGELVRLIQRHRDVERRDVIVSIFFLISLMGFVSHFVFWVTCI